MPSFVRFNMFCTNTMNTMPHRLLEVDSCTSRMHLYPPFPPLPIGDHHQEKEQPCHMRVYLSKTESTLYGLINNDFMLKLMVYTQYNYRVSCCANQIRGAIFRLIIKHGKLHIFRSVVGESRCWADFEAHVRTSMTCMRSVMCNG